MSATGCASRICRTCSTAAPRCTCAASVGTIAARTYEDLLPEDEAWNRDDAPPEQYYIVRFRQKDLWEGYPFENDTLQTELPDRWLEPAGD